MYGEQLLLKKQFNIDSQLVLEAIRKNKTGFRAGTISVRWVLVIYANNIDKFIEEIGFISERKNAILEQMKQIKGNNPQYYAITIIKRIMNTNNFFYRKDFIKEMTAEGYKSPSCYLNRYLKGKHIIRTRRGVYQLRIKD